MFVEVLTDYSFIKFWYSSKKGKYLTIQSNKIVLSKKYSSHSTILFIY